MWSSQEATHTDIHGCLMLTIQYHLQTCECDTRQPLLILSASCPATARCQACLGSRLNLTLHPVSLPFPPVTAVLRAVVAWQDAVSMAPATSVSLLQAPWDTWGRTFEGTCLALKHAQTWK